VKEKFKVQFLQEAAEFIDKLDQSARRKVIYNIRKAQIISNKELFKKLNKEIWEFRTLYSKTCYRLFAFWDKTGKKETVVISTHGIIKKTGKTPKLDLEKAEGLRKAYFENKFKKS
jgi:phage-related protein